MLALIFHISFFDSFYIKILILYATSLDRKLYEPISVYPDLKEISFIKIILKYISQLLNFMNQISCVGNMR